MKKSKVAFKIAVPVVLILLLIVPFSRNWIVHIVTLLSGSDLDSIREYIKSFGPLAVVVSFLMMILQSLVAPLPAFIITITNAAVFGWIGGAILSWVSSMTGAALCFGIARLYGRNAVAKLTGKGALESVDDFFVKYGAKSIIIARLLPFVPFDPISYAAGLTGMSFLSFFIATGIGQLPATLIYSYAGTQLAGGAKNLVTGLFILFAVVTLSTIVKSIYTQKKKKAVETIEVETIEVETTAEVN